MKSNTDLTPMLRKCVPYFIVCVVLLLQAHAEETIAVKSDDQYPDSYWDRVVTPAPHSPCNNFSQFTTALLDPTTNLLVVDVPVREKVERELATPVVKYKREQRTRTVRIDGRNVTKEYSVDVPHTFAYSRIFSWMSPTEKTTQEPHKNFGVFRVAGSRVVGEELGLALKTKAPVLFFRGDPLAVPLIPTRVVAMLRADALVVVVESRVGR